jgi:hypothetical protein
MSGIIHRNSNKSEVWLPNISRNDKFSLNLCDPTTWWYSSEQRTDQSLTRSTEFIYTFPDTNIIDLNHGKISDEDDLFSSYGLIIKIDSVTQDIDTPFGTPGDQDYSMNYSTGTVTFNSSVSAESTVTATYSYENGSLYKISPIADKKLIIIGAECQISSEITLNDSTIYEIWGKPYPGASKILLRSKIYKTALDFMNESNGAYPVVPAWGGTKRGTTQTGLIFPWNYKVRSELLSSLEFEVRVYLENDIAHTGEFATVTFYCISETE